MFRIQTLRPGDSIDAPFIDGIAEVKKFEKRDNFYSLEAVLRKNKKFESFQLDESQARRIEKVGKDFSTEGGEDLFLQVEASRIRRAYQFDPILAVNTSMVDPLPHQIEAVYDYALNTPKVRFLIADDAGAGKTIMGGLIVKELQYRSMADRVLIVVPGHLKYQWQREMREKFNTNFKIIDRGVIRASGSENVWEENRNCIATIDFIKQEGILNSLRGINWDLVVVDEAHKMAAYKYGDEIDKTDRYQAGEVLSNQTNHMLFLTATPHKGKKENFRLFLDLLRPGFFSKEELIQEAVKNRDNPVFIRRLKEDLEDFEGDKLFPPRHVNSVKFNMTPAERDLYQSVTKYIQNYYDKAKDNRHIAFAMMILQRRLTSSINAILESLKRRKEKLSELLKLPEKIKGSDEYEELRGLEEDEIEREIEDKEEERRNEIEEKFTLLTIARNLDEVKSEIKRVNGLIEKANKVKNQGIESKLSRLKNEILDNIGDKKLLIFTEFTDTLEYLVEKLENWGYEVTSIDGSMSMDARVEAEKEFEEDKQILVATEAAGEGINLQFCSLMVNYDIPWNPNRLDQRMGRIHRYGQEEEVYIWNMISKDTREGQILEKLFTKLDKMREDLGTNRVFDVVGEVIPGTNFEDMFKETILEQRRMDEIYDKIEETDNREVEEKLDDLFSRGLATRHIDYTGASEKMVKAQENRLSPEYIEDYFLRAFERYDGKIKRVKDYYRIESVPYELRKFNEDDEFKSNFGRVKKKYSQVSFDKEVSKERDYEYLGPGHPLLAAVNKDILENFSGKSYAYFTDETGSKEGTLWFFRGKVKDGTGGIAGEKVFCVYRNRSGEVKKINPSVLWDLNPLESRELGEDEKGILNDKEDIENYVVNEILFPYRGEVAEKRERETGIKEKYGLKSIDYQIQELNENLLEYQERQTKGEDMDMPILRKERRKKRLEERKEKLKKEIKLERNLTIVEPEFIGAAIVEPGEEQGGYGEEMVSDPEIEKVGMEVAQNYEGERGWDPVDVSEKNLGFDIRSTKYRDDGSPKEVRYVEVKARAREGAVRLSSNEWKKARRFGDDYWLYIVVNAGTENPELGARIQNPAGKFTLEEDIYATGYKIPLESWKGLEG